MFVGSLSDQTRKFLASVAGVFEGRTVIVGPSGAFGWEAVISRYGSPAAIHSADSALVSCMLGRFLTGEPVTYDVTGADYAWLEPLLETDAQRAAALLVLADMLDFDKRDNAHRVRMWNAYHANFPDLLAGTVDRLRALQVAPTSFYEGDVLDHFRRFADDPTAVFCFAHQVAVGPERATRLDRIIRWQGPFVVPLDEGRIDTLRQWLAESGRPFLWLDDRVLPDWQPVMLQRRGRLRRVYLYSNVVDRPALFAGLEDKPLPNLPLADASLRIRPKSPIALHRIKTTDLFRFKEAFLGRNVNPAQGMWGFAVMIGGAAIGFLEFNEAEFMSPDTLYLMADFAVPGTIYPRLSKLVLALALSGETRRVLERTVQRRLRRLFTTAFTDREVSMKYRGVMDLHRRGQTAEGQKFLNYVGGFNAKPWKEVLNEWWTRYGSKS
jgi:hypothetical protein